MNHNKPFQKCLIVLALASLSVSTSGESQASPSSQKENKSKKRSLKRVQALTAEMCACTNAACVEKVGARSKKFSKQIEEVYVHYRSTYNQFDECREKFPSESTKKKRSGEAIRHLNVLRGAVQAHFASHNRLPAAVSVTPAKGSCCSERLGVCKAGAKAWKRKGWKALGFSPIHSAHRYSYEIEIGEGDPKSVTIKAYGDLDCDQKFSKYTLYGEVRQGTLEMASDVIKYSPLE